MKDRDKARTRHVARIEAVLDLIKGREIPAIMEGSSAEEAIDAIVKFPHSRLLYVTDEAGRLVGTVSLGNLVRHFFSWSHEPRIHPRLLIGMITAETVEDIMERDLVFTSADEDVESVLKRMVEKNVKEIAVLDDEKRPVGDVTMVDLLRFLIQSERNPPPRRRKKRHGVNTDKS
jgi:CBS domain-containing protein